MGYVFQHPDFGLGNFINLTPAIRRLHELKGERIPVYFSSEYVRRCFLNCPFVQILDEKPEYGPLFGSDMVNPENDKPDYQYVFERVTGEKWTPDYHTYIDHRNDAKEGDYILIINGSGSESLNYVASKDPGMSAYLTAIKLISGPSKMQIVATGSEHDAERNPWMIDIADAYDFGKIRLALMLISCAAWVIANDTGLAHAAGAMNKRLIVLWKDTPRERCKNPGLNTEYWYV